MIAKYYSGSPLQGCLRTYGRDAGQSSPMQDNSGGIEFGNVLSGLEAKLTQAKESLTHAQTVAKTEAAVKRIAGFLGVSYDFLLMIMESLGIKPEDLIDQKKIGEVVKKLSEYFGFDEEKKKEFEEYMSKTCEAINAGFY